MPRRGQRTSSAPPATWDDAATSDLLAYIVDLLGSDRDPRAELAATIPVARAVLARTCTRWGCDRPARGTCPDCRAADTLRHDNVLPPAWRTPAGWAG